MKLPNFQVIKTDDNRFKLVSDQGHSHYKEAIEMLLKSEMFIKHNAHLLYIYCLGLSMVEEGDVDKAVSPYELLEQDSMQDWAKCFVDYADSVRGDIDDLIENSCGERKEVNTAKKVRFDAVVELVKKVFPEITQTN